MSNPALPSVGQRVDIWFDGYDEYYGGIVKSVTPPYSFHVILDDNSSWDVDSRKNIYRLTDDTKPNKPEADQVDADPDAEGLPSTPPAIQDIDADLSIDVDHDEDENLPQVKKDPAPRPPRQLAARTRSRLAAAEIDTQPPAPAQPPNPESSAQPKTPPPASAVIADPGTTEITEQPSASSPDKPTEESNDNHNDAAMDSTPDKTDKSANSEKPDKTDNSEKPDKTDNPETSDKTDKPDKPAEKGVESDPAPARPEPRVTRSREARPDPHMPAEPLSSKPDTQPAEKPDEKPETQADKNADEKSETPKPDESTRPRRRTSGRALRKNTNGPRTREPEVKPTPTEEPSTPTPTRPKRAAAASVPTAGARVTRSRRSSEGSDPDAKAMTVSPPSAGRRTRLQQKAVGPGVLRKRGVSEMLKSDQMGGMLKKRRVADEDDMRMLADRRVERPALRVVSPERRATPERRGPGRPPRPTVTFHDDVKQANGTARSARMSGGDDHAVEKVSTKAVTALAVDAALESAKAVLDPINNRLNKLLRELDTVSKDLVLQKKAMDQEMAAPAQETGGSTEGATVAGTQTEEAKDEDKSGPVMSKSISVAALENFQLDVSEIIGGGEARIKAYSSLSQQEFEGLHRLIEQQGKALREMDRLLYAAQAFAEKSKTKE